MLEVEPIGYSLASHSPKVAETPAKVIQRQYMAVEGR